MMSKRTKQCRARKNIFSILHFLCLFGPLIYFIPYSFIQGDVGNKMMLSITLVTSVILAIAAIFSDTVHRAGLHKSIMWIMIAGVLFCLQQVKTFIWIMAITSILDELIFVRLKNYYRECLIANKEIDKRNSST